MPAVEIAELAHDGEAEAAATRCRVARVLEPEKGRENLLAHRRWNARSLVDDGHDGSGLAAGGIDLHGLVVPMAQRVADEIVENASQRRRRHALVANRSDAETNRHPFALVRGLQRCQQLGQCHVRGLVLAEPAREFEGLAHEPVHGVDFRIETLNLFAWRLRRQQCEFELHARQWCAQIVRDAREHGVEVRPICVNASFWDNVMEPDGQGGLALRLGLRQIKGLSEEDASWLTAARGNGYQSVRDVWRRAGLAPAMVERLAEADVFSALGLTRRDALWEAKALAPGAPLPLFAGDIDGEAIDEPAALLPQMTLGEEVVEDYVAMRLTLRAHPLALLRHLLTPGAGMAP